MGRTIILSIKPEFVEKIKSGEKLFEYRKMIPGDIDKIIVYTSWPIKKVEMSCEVEKILLDTPENIWEQTKDYSGISKEQFLEYFKDKEKAYAIQLKGIEFFDKPKELSDFGVKTAPQSYMYI